MGKVEKIMEKIIGNEQEIKELLSKESVDDLYEFFLKKDNTLTMEEFDDEVYDILENYSKTSNEEIDKDTLEQISGGEGGFLKKTLAVSLSALTVGSAAASSTFAAGNHGIESNSRSGAVKSNKDKVKGRFVKIGKWFSDHKKAVAITGGALGAAAIGAVVLAVVMISKNKNTGNSSDLQVQSKGNKEKENSVSTSGSSSVQQSKKTDSDSNTGSENGNSENSSSSGSKTSVITKTPEGSGTGDTSPSSTVSESPSSKISSKSPITDTALVVHSGVDSKDSKSAGTVSQQNPTGGLNGLVTAAEKKVSKGTSATPAQTQNKHRQNSLSNLLKPPKKTAVDANTSSSSNSTSGEGSKPGIFARIANLVKFDKNKDQQHSDTAAATTKPSKTLSEQQKKSDREGPADLPPSRC